MKNQIKISVALTIIAFASCTSTKKIMYEKEMSVNSLSRNEYTITDDKSAEGTVTQHFGLWYSTTGEKHKKGVIRNHAGTLSIGNFNFNYASAFISLAVSAGTGLLLANTDINSGSFKYQHITDPNYPGKYLTNAVAYPTGLVVGFGLNLLFASPTKPAEKLATYNLMTENKFDYVINPRFEINKNNSFFKKTSTVKITAKGLNIKTDK